MTAGVALSLCIFCGHPSPIRAGPGRRFARPIGSRAPPPPARTCARACTRAHRCTYTAILTRAQQAMHNHAGTCARGTLQELHTRSRARTHAPFSVLRCAVPPVSVPAAALGSLGAPCCSLRVVSPPHAPARSTPKHEQVVGFDDFKALQQTKGMGDVKAAGKYRQVPASVCDTRFLPCWLLRAFL